LVEEQPILPSELAIKAARLFASSAGSCGAMVRAGFIEAPLIAPAQNPHAAMVKPIANAASLPTYAFARDGDARTKAGAGRPRKHTAQRKAEGPMKARASHRGNVVAPNGAR
jgi:hypothetical protein